MLVVREEYLHKKELDECIQQLQLSNVNLLGCVINDAQGGMGYYRKYTKYKKYEYKKSESTENNNVKN